MKTLTVTFEVDDDLTSERAADYRATIVQALQYTELDLDPHHHGDELEMIDHMLNDCNR